MPHRKSPLISIGLPVYNGETHLPQALDSTLAQTCEDFELIVCDNASTDRSAEICCDYAARDRRIRYIRNQVNLGASRNYRLSFEAATGQYFRWANHDDTVAPDLLAQCCEVLQREPSAVLVYGQTTLIDAAGSPIAPYPEGLHIPAGSPAERFAHVLNNIGMCNIIYGLMRRDAMTHTALIGSYIGSDLSFVAELALYGTFWEIPKPLFFRRIHATAYSQQNDLRKRLEFYDPNTTARDALATWRQLWANVKAVERAPLGFTEKMRLRQYLLRWSFWKKTNLAHELKTHLWNS